MHYRLEVCLHTLAIGGAPRASEAIYQSRKIWYSIDPRNFGKPVPTFDKRQIGSASCSLFE